MVNWLENDCWILSSILSIKFELQNGSEEDSSDSDQNNENNSGSSSSSSSDR